MLRLLAVGGVGVLVLAFHGPLGLTPNGHGHVQPGLSTVTPAPTSADESPVQGNLTCQQEILAARASGASAVTCASGFQGQGSVASPSNVGGRPSPTQSRP